MNKRGYNKFLKMEGDIRVTIDYGKLEADAEWDSLKGYLTNTNIPLEEVTPPTTTYGTLKELSVSQNQR